MQLVFRGLLERLLALAAGKRIVNGLTIDCTTYFLITFMER